jgi:hypothetical protein
MRIRRIIAAVGIAAAAAGAAGILAAAAGAAGTVAANWGSNTQNAGALNTAAMSSVPAASSHMSAASHGGTR